MRKTVRTKIQNVLLLLVLSLASGIAACDGDTTGPNGVSNTNFFAQEDFSVRVAVASQARVRLEGINGNVTVRGAAQTDSFVIEGERRVGSESVEDAEAHLDEIEVRVTDLGNELLIETIQPQNTGGRNYTVNYELVVPSGLELDVGTANGNVDVESISNTLAAGTVNGNVTLTAIEGRTTAGTVNGNITGQVTLPSGGTIDMATVNGNISLSIPTSTSAELSATVTNGNITTSNIVVQNATTSPTSLTGTLGAGDGTITLVTVNGNVAVTGF